MFLPKPEVSWTIDGCPLCKWKGPASYTCPWRIRRYINDQRQKNFGPLPYIVMHQLRCPLNTLRNFLQVLYVTLTHKVCLTSQIEPPATHDVRIVFSNQARGPKNY